MNEIFSSRGLRIFENAARNQVYSAPVPQFGPVLEDVADSAFGVTYRFGPFMLDTAHRLLLSGSQAKPLSEKLFRILVLLLEANGKTIHKDTFFATVWRNESITDANLTQHIFMLRQILGEHAGENTYVVTVAGEGYRFAVPVETKVGLAMKGSCETCGTRLPHESAAFICSFECTFCEMCARAREYRCPNCGGELAARPRRRSS